MLSGQRAGVSSPGPAAHVLEKHRCTGRTTAARRRAAVGDGRILLGPGSQLDGDVAVITSSVFGHEAPLLPADCAPSALRILDNFYQLTPNVLKSSFRKVLVELAFGFSGQNPQTLRQ